MTHASDMRNKRCSATPDPALPYAWLTSQHDRLFGAKSLVQDAIRRQTALLTRHPNCPASLDVERIAAGLIDG